MHVVTIEQVLLESTSKTRTPKISLAGRLLGDVTVAELSAHLPSADKRDQPEESDRVYTGGTNILTEGSWSYPISIRELPVQDEEE